MRCLEEYLAVLYIDLAAVTQKEMLLAVTESQSVDIYALLLGTIKLHRPLYVCRRIFS